MKRGDRMLVVFMAGGVFVGLLALERASQVEFVGSVSQKAQLAVGSCGELISATDTCLQPEIRCPPPCGKVKVTGCNPEGFDSDDQESSGENYSFTTGGPACTGTYQKWYCIDGYHVAWLNGDENAWPCHGTVNLAHSC